MSVQEILKEVKRNLENIPGIVGIVLGGSRARGTHQVNSDIDIGIYYDESAFNVDTLNKIATELDDEHRPNLITSLGEWGPWVNGGGWLVIQGYHVDFIFRDVNRVFQVIDDCLKGSITVHYQTGHPHAYLNVMYMGEISICKILTDPTNRLTELKAKTRPYPKSLQKEIINWFKFEASFSLMFAEKSLKNDDVSYVAGHCFRAVSSLNQLLFARNEEYCINEKKAVKLIELFEIKPADYKKRVDQIFTRLSSENDSTEQAIQILQDLVIETERLL
ncbi:Nucleotidyltransferase domain-containing protein [Seinonella peptonophila]|uniref:Nucleotidyltransferase domain-containing protein n=1 Tax=Seinonella peptonophila TaxID=112248 RepID=A0A1M5BJV4_9BACL|nr:nucleotidyltransferase domain-containing protein [Seinonella peptonophila]SHF42736.1 Nucleotidyltransferase domain-containing protein [Seinonella peptonophila]